jgi:two-component system, cell cycle sensor histidine kinase and response regulator CckA
MDENTINRIFEPFFTTKNVGEGTGMGLAMVYAAVRQHKGWITVISEVGQGTTFTLFLPISTVESTQSVVSTATMPVGYAPTSLPVGQNLGVATAADAELRVLLVEDDPAVRKVMRLMLMRSGCTVIEADTAAQGYAQWTAHREEIDLIITDLIMPGGYTGEDLARQILIEAPGTPVIYCSGYSPGLFDSKESLVNNENFLPKPYDSEHVNSVLRSVRRGPRSRRPVTTTEGLSS